MRRVMNSGLNWRFHCHACRRHCAGMCMDSGEALRFKWRRVVPCQRRVGGMRKLVCWLSRVQKHTSRSVFAHDPVSGWERRQRRYLQGCAVPMGAQVTKRRLSGARCLPWDETVRNPKWSKSAVAWSIGSNQYPLVNEGRSPCSYCAISPSWWIARNSVWSLAYKPASINKITSTPLRQQPDYLSLRSQS